MSKDPRHYDIIIAPVITEKATMASEANQVVFKVKRNVTGVNTLLRKGKTKVFRGVRGVQQDVKKAIVTLADGERIDVTTGL